jgi:FtsZ-binding cell division protein ZapB
MNDVQKAKVQQALDVLTDRGQMDANEYKENKNDAIAGLRQLLEQQVQEPLSSSDVESFYKALAADERSKTFSPINWFQAGVFISEAKLREKNGGAA